MNVKSRTFSLLAAATLSLTMFGGAIAQNTDSESVSTVLTNNASLCTVNISSTSGGLGTWAHNGTGFVETSGTSRQYFSASHADASGNLCKNLSFTFGGLTGPGGTIGLENFSAYSLDWVGDIDPAGHTVLNANFYQWGSTWDFTYTLNSVPSTMTVGTYTGSINATVSNGV